jgi:hypothetical protein
MSSTLEPRQVEKPFVKRWLRMTWQLFVRSPIRFGILIALFGWVDYSAVKVADGLVFPRIWVSRCGMLLLPLLWVVVGAVAKGADDSRQSWAALHELTHVRLWKKALIPGAVLIAWSVAVYIVLEAFFGTPASPQVRAPLHEPGRLLQTVAAQSWLVASVFGICYAPLLVFWPQLSFRETEKLSRSASAINGSSQISWLFVGVLCVGAPLDLVPTYGLGDAALIVFTGALNYVAYRDIFERRDENLPVIVASAPTFQAAES